VRLPEVADQLGLKQDTFEVLGCFAGGMGMCLRLRALEGGAEFALKSPLPELVSDANSTARFVEELRVWLAASACTGVAEALAVIKINEMPAVVGTWLEGGDWTKTIKSTPPQVCLTNLLRIVRTLDWVRENLGVIHRDLKPANILLDNQQLAHVADWGLARPVSKLFSDLHLGNPGRYARPAEIHETRLGAFVGTVLYAAPEQIIGSATVDHRADIYSLGCIMFELETGAPPFLGEDVAEIAAKHLRVAVPKIGGLLRSTKLGIEKIIARCLEKDPNARYPTYYELAQALAEVAKRQRLDVSKSAIATRYRRNVPGRGYPALLPENAIRSPDGAFAVVEWEDIAPLFDEADNLIGLGRFTDGAKILERFYVPEAVADRSEWDRMHFTGCNLAYCLSSIEANQEKALRIFEQLSPLRGKPVNFYINFSLALLRAHRGEDALNVCQRGVRYYPDDPDLIGNLAIALLHTDHKSEAAEACLKRLSIRRDLHSLEESAVTLQSIAGDLKFADLPSAAKYAQLALELANEGLMLKPDHAPLLLSRGRTYRFFNRGELAAGDYKAVSECPCHRTIKETALLQFAGILEEDKLYDSALSFVEKWKPHIASLEIAQDIEAIKMRIVCHQFMLGKIQNGHRAVVPEVVEFFRSTTGVHDAPKYPVDFAKVEEWLGKSSEAMSILEAALKTKPDNLDAIQTLTQILLNSGHQKEAEAWAQQLIQIAPWKAEAYDLAALVARRVGDEQAAAAFKSEGDRIFNLESELLTL